MDRLETTFAQTKKQKNVVETNTENARYRIIYGIHQIETDPKTIENTDGVILELMGDYSTPEKGRKSLDFLVHKVAQYRKIIRACQETRKPIFLTDLSKDTRMRYDKEVLLKEVVAPTAELLVGMALAGWVAKDVWDKSKMTRRDFLKTGAKALAGMYLATPQASLELLDFTQEPDEETLRRKAAKVVTNFSRSIHPELAGITVNCRNLLFAQKSEAVAKIMKSERKERPNLGIIVGAVHFGVENTLKMKEGERIAKLKEYLGDSIERESVIARIDFTGEGNNVVKVSILEDATLRNSLKNT